MLLQAGRYVDGRPFHLLAISATLPNRCVASLRGPPRRLSLRDSSQPGTVTDMTSYLGVACSVLMEQTSPHMKKIDIFLRSLLCTALFFSLTLSAQDKTAKPAMQDNTPKYKNAALPVEDRVADLVSRMTLEEKIGQIAPA